MTAPKQRTIREPRAMDGIGLHTGAPVRMRISPADVDTGVIFRRSDLQGQPTVKAGTDRVVGTDRGTTLGVGETRIHTIEHVLSAVVGMVVDNLVVDLDGPEPPAADGSAQPFVDLLRSAGVVEQNRAAPVLAPRERFSFREGDAEYVVEPSDAYRVSAEIEFEHPLISRQSGSFEISTEIFQREIAPARTFGFVSEVGDLRARGLALGGSPDNAIVLTEDGLIEGTALRFADEFVRHKVMDLVGDLGLLGGRLRVHISARRPSHRGNVALAREIRSRLKKPSPPQPILNIQQILESLPHRYPLLLVDRVIEFEERKRIVGLKNVTINEPFFAGHFPGHPIMPGVLIIEAMAQVGGLLVMQAVENPEDKIVYFMSLDNVKWRRPVTPGDQIRFEVEIVQIRGMTARMKGVGTVEGQVVAEAEMMARIVDR
jgi:UDP-3-O-[3-hydroxymyristoyl] N-acetylglucosamine deacetylase / 3-hydroxyacyl-[acyl-carrier-protein] dehydratase